MNTQALNPTSSNIPYAPTADLLGRIGLAAIFLLAGMNKITNYAGSAQFLASSGLPEQLLPLVIVFEIVGALAIILGFQTRISAFLLAGFCAVTALLYHNNLSNQVQFLMFFKNIGMAGGFLVLSAHGADRFSIDHYRTHK